MGRRLDKKRYNDIPVTYCPRCLSLRILSYNGFDYCDDCDNTDLTEGHIDTWMELKKGRGESFVRANTQESWYNKFRKGEYRIVEEE